MLKITLIFVTFSAYESYIGSVVRIVTRDGLVVTADHVCPDSSVTTFRFLLNSDDYIVLVKAKVNLDFTPFPRGKGVKSTLLPEFK